MLVMFPKSVMMISYWHKLQCLLNTFINLLFMILQFPTKKNNNKNQKTEERKDEKEQKLITA